MTGRQAPFTDSASDPASIAEVNLESASHAPASPPPRNTRRCTHPLLRLPQVTDEFLAQVSSLTLQLQAAQEEQRAASTQVGERQCIWSCGQSLHRLKFGPLGPTSRFTSNIVSVENVLATVLDGAWTVFAPARLHTEPFGWSHRTITAT